MLLLLYLYSPEMVASKKEIQNFKKIHNNQKRKQKQTICIIGYFHNIPLSVALEKKIKEKEKK